MTTDTQTAANVTIVYDGDCPICRTYMRYLHLKESVGTVEMVDARQPSPLMEDITARGYDLDKGFVVKVGDVFYSGADALHVLSGLSSSATFLNRFAYRLFRNKRFSRFCYPFFKGVRSLVLRVSGIPYIRNLEQPPQKRDVF